MAVILHSPAQENKSEREKEKEERKKKDERERKRGKERKKRGRPCVKPETFLCPTFSPIREELSAHYGTKPGHFETLKIHFSTSEGVSKVSKRANE